MALGWTPRGDAARNGGVGNYAPSVASLCVVCGRAAVRRRGLPMSRPSWAGHAPNATGSCDKHLATRLAGRRIHGYRRAACSRGAAAVSSGSLGGMDVTVRTKLQRSLGAHVLF